MPFNGVGEIQFVIACGMQIGLPSIFIEKRPASCCNTSRWDRLLECWIIRERRLLTSSLVPRLSRKPSR